MKYKLQKGYPNDFLALTNGQIFYNKDNSLGKPETISELKRLDEETTEYLRFKTLVPVEEETFQKESLLERVSEELKDENSEEKDMKIEKTFKENKTSQVFRETKTLSNDKIIEESKNATEVNSTTEE